MKTPENLIFICAGSKCGKHKHLRKALREAIKENGLKKEIEIIKMECSDRCKHAPVLCVQPRNEWFLEATEKDIQAILK